MSRQIFLDTETTGLYAEQGHRIIEIAAVEVINRRLTNRHFHQYLNPDREIDAGAQEVHGISLEFLQDKPRFANIMQEFLDFVQDAELIIHNAPFDLGFINSELALQGKAPINTVIGNVIDTLAMAREMRPGQRNNLDALCRAFDIDNSKRTLHGALLDAELLADVYLAMTRGQESLLTSLQPATEAQIAVTESHQRLPLVVLAANPEELAQHQDYLQQLGKNGDALWAKINNMTTQ